MAFLKAPFDCPTHARVLRSNVPRRSWHHQHSAAEAFSQTVRLISLWLVHSSQQQSTTSRAAHARHSWGPFSARPPFACQACVRQAGGVYRNGFLAFLCSVAKYPALPDANSANADTANC
eukprot:1008301-Pelagomonas_calceolata.AAC.3